MWDDFVERQYRRLEACVDGGDLIILANNTNGACGAIGHANAILFTEEEILDLGLARAGTGELLWYNVDYPLYFFYRSYPEYDYYVICEYDVVLNASVDGLVRQVADRKADLVGLTKGPTPSEWMFLPTCLELYELSDIQKLLLPFGILSNRAVKRLMERRLELSGRVAGGELTTWPMCEAFIPTEVALAGFDLAELSAFGSVRHFDYMPALFEGDLEHLAAETFLHPVLDRTRYIASTLKYETRPERYFYPGHSFRQKLTRFPFHQYRQPLGEALRRRSKRVATIIARGGDRRL